MTFNLFGAEPPPDMFAHEYFARRQGFQAIAGIDEAGRGPLAGPVVAAAVILPVGVQLPEVNDSKKLSAKVRNRLFDQIYDAATAVGVGMSDSSTIDRINILQATLRAMEEAVGKLSPVPDYLLVDGISRTLLAIPQKTIKGGDSRSCSIAAASIIAKVTRDRMMETYEQLYPGYGLAGHKGYGSPAHLAAIASLGPSPIHRLTFRGVKEHLR